MRYIYSLVFYLILPLIFLRLKLKSARLKEYGEHWRERMGYAPVSTKPVIWLHAVSVGETIASAPLVKAIKQQLPDYDIIITNMTPTGRRQAEKSLGDLVSHSFVPYDYPAAVKRFLDRVKPELLIIMETELWPNLIHYTAKKNIPIMLANARLSKKSARGYQLIRFFVQSMLQKINIIAAQAESDAKRFLSLGAEKNRVISTGSIKFDLNIPTELISEGKLLRSSWDNERPVWIAASSHAGEEEKILAAHKKIREKMPSALLILVPRHPERFDEVYDLCVKNEFSVVRRSDGKPCANDINVFLGDSMGELFLYYGMSDVAYVAGSLVEIGGHNMLEPAAMGLPVISGHYYHNFVEIVNLLLSAKALLIVNNEAELAEKIIVLFEDKALQQQMGQAGKAVVNNNKGAVRKHVDWIVTKLG